MDRELAWGLAAAVALIALGGVLAQQLARIRARMRGRAHNVRGQRGERAAELLLEAHGYSVVARQSATRYPVEVDGDLVEVTLQADFLVTRGGQRFVAEVKTGRHAPRFQTPETRRQLLEYQLAFGVDSVLLVEVESAVLREVRFPLAERPAARSSSAWVLASVLLCLVAYWVSRR
jgi:Holliday junction resolvase